MTTLWPNLDVARIRLRDQTVIVAEVPDLTSIEEIRQIALEAGLTGTVYAEPVTLKDGARRQDAIAIAVRPTRQAEPPMMDPDAVERAREGAEAKRAEREASTRILQANIHSASHVAEIRIQQAELRTSTLLEEAERRYQRELARVQLQADDDKLRLQRQLDAVEDDMRQMRSRHEARVEHTRQEEQSLAARRIGALEDAQARERMNWEVERERLEKLLNDHRTESAQLRKKWTETQSEVLEAQRSAASARGQVEGTLSREIVNMQAMAKMARDTPELLPIVMAKLNPELAPHPLERAIERAAPIIERVIAMRAAQGNGQRPTFAPTPSEDERL
jgi:hypothetical protein